MWITYENKLGRQAGGWDNIINYHIKDLHLCLFSKLLFINYPNSLLCSNRKTLGK